MSDERAPLEPDDPRHGTPNGYTNYACRCRECKAAWSAYPARQAAQEKWRVKAGVVSAPEVRKRRERRGADTPVPEGTT